MKQKIINALTKDVGLKILAVVFSFLLWLVVVNIDDPTQTRTFTAVVTVTNADVLKEAGKLYEIKDGVNTVSFRVTAKRSIIEKLSPSDFSATADMNSLENEERIPVTIAAKSYANYITISSKQNYLYVVLEDEQTERFVIEAQTTGTIETGLTVDSVTSSPTVITVTGPEDVVSTIDKVVASANITGVTSNFTESVIPKFYDSEGEEVDSKELTLSVSTVSVSVTFSNIKTVDLVVKTSGTLDSSLTLDSIKTDPSSVGIKGEATALNDVTSITIPDTVINLSDLTGSFTTTVDISSYMPEGITLADGSSSKVTIYVLMSGETASTAEVSADNISLTNIPEGLAVSLDASSVTVNVFGTSDALSALNASSIKGTIDCTNLTVGESQTVVVQFENIEGVTIQNTSVTVTVIEDTSAATEDSEE
ncbi:MULTISPECIES: CdaR family protein [unclassified Pseudobutyrivibrio]|uniref:CdaR family protein n=1 Tax=unclassified Pseudobutyrivibrio TaxID=2638619 RepID=UPI00067999F6|nr:MULTISPECIES: CdaR family protein [unclassified Pseudobutyrivibrio]SET26861.1 YbbR domain-containing protein [Pseudobutyrivibrio sp. C4]